VVVARDRAAVFDLALQLADAAHEQVVELTLLKQLQFSRLSHP
jgi:hypothetical protein